MGTGKLLGKPDKLPGSDLRLHATETEISSGSYEPILAPRLHFISNDGEMQTATSHPIILKLRALQVQRPDGAVTL